MWGFAPPMPSASIFRGSNRPVLPSGYHERIKRLRTGGNADGSIGYPILSRCLNCVILSRDAIGRKGIGLPGHSAEAMGSGVPTPVAMTMCRGRISRVAKI
jgi:hypothetical protein